MRYMVYIQMLEACEGIAPTLNMDLTGLHLIALKDESIRNCVTELK